MRLSVKFVSKQSSLNIQPQKDVTLLLQPINRWLNVSSSCLHMAHKLETCGSVSFNFGKGHLGVQKSIDRITSTFHCPGIAADVTLFYCSCDVCQKTTPMGRVTKVPLEVTFHLVSDLC